MSSASDSSAAASGACSHIDGKFHLFDSRDVRVPRVWEIASTAGLTIGVTNYWFTYPAQSATGYVISDHAIPSRSERVIQHFSGGQSPPPQASALVHPAELMSRLEPALADTPMPAREQFDDSEAGRARLIKDIFAW